MDFKELIRQKGKFLMEGALGERLKRDYHLQPDERTARAGFVYTGAGRAALRALWKEYAAIAGKYRLPFFAMTPYPPGKPGTGRCVRLSGHSESG